MWWSFAYRRRPIRNITALSYSDTTLKHTNKENGNVMTIRIMDKTVAITSMHPKLSFSAEIEE